MNTWDKKYRADITGLRGIAIIAVVVYHLNENWLRGGFVGVDIFFVLSGYLMTEILIKNDTSLWDFYASRLKRIVPALLAMCATVFIAALLLFGFGEFKYTMDTMKNALRMGSNLYFYNKDIPYGDITFYNPLLHTWSLGVEFQFYMLYSIKMLVAHKANHIVKKHYTLVFLGLTSLIYSEYAIETAQYKEAFYLVHTRFWEFMAGAFAAMAVPWYANDEKKSKQWSTILATVAITSIVITCIAENIDGFQGIKAVPLVAATALLLYAGKCNQNTMIYRILSSKPLVGIGLISYSLYLWHWPIIAFTKQLYGENTSTIALGVIAFVSVLCGYFSWRFIENPVRRKKIKAYKAIIGATLICLWASIIVSYGKNLHTMLVATSPLLDTTSPIACSSISNCNKPDAKGHYQVLQIGDSHTEGYTPFITQWAAKKGQHVRVLVQGLCNTNTKKAEKDCDTFDALVEKILATEPITTIFIDYRTSGFIHSTEKRQQWLEQSLIRIQHNAKGAKIILLGQVPELTTDVRVFLGMPPLRKWFVNEPTLQFIEQTKTQTYESHLAKIIGADYINPRPYMVQNIHNGKIIYKDSNHLNKEGASYVSGILQKMF